MISRRRFVTQGARAAAVVAGSLVAPWGRSTLLAQAPDGYRALVCVFLQGGNDSSNMLVPLDAVPYQAYASARGPLALAPGALLPVADPLGETYGFHPQLASCRRLFEQGRMAVVANVGMLVEPTTREAYLNRLVRLPRNLFSHLDQQLAWQTAAPDGGSVVGWGGRLADRWTAGADRFPAIVSVAGASVFATGETSQPATLVPGLTPGLAGLDGSNGARAREQAIHQMLELDGGALLVQAANRRMRDGLQQASVLQAALAEQPALSTVFPRSGLGQQLSDVARVIQARAALGVARQVFFCALDGFDTHASQLPLQDAAYAELGGALGAFADALAEMGVGDAVTTFTQSEFGRTLQPTSGSGSDHAWGSHQLVMGGAVDGGRIHGRMPTLVPGGPDDAGTRGVWLPSQSLDQYGATLASWFGVPVQDLTQIFPNLGNFASPTLGFLRP